MEQIGQGIVQLELTRLQAFPNHPYRVVADESMTQLIESIRQFGVLSPIIVRYLDGINWQIISGHRRKFACEQLGITTIPAITKEINADEAIIMMVDSNFQRESFFPVKKRGPTR